MSGTGANVVSFDERQLLLRHRQGETDAFESLVQSYRAPVYSYLVRSGVRVEDRDDLFQDVFIRIHRSAAQYQADRPLHPWVFTIVANAVRNHLRRLRVRAMVSGRLEAPETPDDSADGEREALAREAAMVLEGEIRRLPEKQREVLLLVSLEDLKQQDVAKILGLPLNTVKTLLCRARLRLAEVLVARGLGGGAS